MSGEIRVEDGVHDAAELRRDAAAKRVEAVAEEPEPHSAAGLGDGLVRGGAVGIEASLPLPRHTPHQVSRKREPLTRQALGFVGDGAGRAGHQGALGGAEVVGRDPGRDLVEGGDDVLGRIHAEVPGGEGIGHGRVVGRQHAGARPARGHVLAQAHPPVRLTRRDAGQTSDQVDAAAGPVLIRQGLMAQDAPGPHRNIGGGGDPGRIDPAAEVFDRAEHHHRVRLAQEGKGHRIQHGRGQITRLLQLLHKG
nr:hypothetical protein [Cryobacterium sp. M23]